MFWHEDERPEGAFEVPDDVCDLVFRLQGNSIGIDHAHALALALGEHLDADICARIGVHGIRMASSGNGWNRPEGIGAEIPLSRRARLDIRVPRDLVDAVLGLSNRRISLGQRQVEIGSGSIRPLTCHGTLYARAVSCDRQQAEADFLQQVADELRAMDIDVSRMLCGRCGEIRGGSEDLFTRALLIADLKPRESVRLQQRGIGGDRLLGCGLFVPHKEIDAIYAAQETD